MKYDAPLISAILLQRYKRFLADVRLEDGTESTVHTPNTGSMLGCSEPGMRIWLRRASNPSRKYPLSWVVSETSNGTFIGVDTLLPNHLVAESVRAGLVSQLNGYKIIRTEVPYGTERSRIDLLLQGHPSSPDCYVEVKNVTLVDQHGTAQFPDAHSSRGTKHLRELSAVVARGERAVMFYLVQRDDAVVFTPATAIDPIYSKTLVAAYHQGVEVLIYQAVVTTTGVELGPALPFLLPG